MLVSGGLGLAGLGLASGTQAEPGFGSPPLYHWCPGDFWDPGWGFNWDGGVCHDDHHRDADAWDHSRDWNGPPPWQPAPPWQPPWQPQPWQH
jgi:hypothetical protein